MQTCKHCGEPIREGEKDVNWDWIHDAGWYQCWMVVPSVGYGHLAEPA